MPRNTLNGTEFQTTLPVSVRRGAGTVVEVTSRTDTSVTTISCYAEVVPELNLPDHAIENPDYFEGTISKDKHRKDGSKKASPRHDVISVVHRGNGYVSVYLPQSVMSRYELRDLLSGSAWQLSGHSMCSHDGAIVYNDLWTRPVAESYKK